MPQNKEYIEREALNKVIDYEKEVCNSGIAKGALEMLKVRVEPAADVVEVRHGRWENGECSNCKFDLRELTDGENDLEQWVWNEGFDYCPVCGALMDKEE